MARRRFGQHFLEPGWVDRVVQAIGPAPDDLFLEIGPGRGALTLALAPRVKHLVAVEIDRDLAPALSARVPGNVRVVEADFLQTDADLLFQPGQRLRVAGNLPYNISTPILFRLLALAGQGRRVSDATLMLQREVADRLAARPGTRDWGVLSACQQLRARVDLRLALPPGAFRPAPRVHSAIVRVTYHPPSPAPRSEAAFDGLVRSIFMQRRKMLANALAQFATSRGTEPGAALAQAGIDGRRRPETLTVAELVGLADVFASAQLPAVL
jgi:16S rRNA (adenine1518-N6/adenine1519-N6)-dimethyltransferase